MGTNYYLHQKPPCPTCGHRKAEPLHIGKSSAGWCFALHVDEADGIRDLPDWVELWSKPGAHIMDEYGDAVSPHDMLLIIMARSWESRAPWSAEQFARDHAIPGPNGLARRALDPRHCIKHGEGTWDCCPGEFS